MIKRILLAAALGLAFANGAQAAVQNYGFSGAFDSGSFAGTRYSGMLSYDDAALTGSGDEFLALTGLSIHFADIGGMPLSFTQNDAEAGSTAEAFISNGAFLGALFSASTSGNGFGFSLVPGYSDIGEAFLAYDGVSFADAGMGSMVYAPVPEPRDWMLMLAGIGLVGVMVERAKRRRV